MNITWFFSKRVRGNGSPGPVLVFLRTDGTEERYSWGFYQNKSIYVAEWLKSKGIKRGDFVAIIPLNLPESFFALMGIILLGAVPVPINTLLLKEPGLVDLRKILNDCRPKVILTNECLEKYLREAGIYCLAIEKIIAESEETRSVLNQRLNSLNAEQKLSIYTPQASENDLLILPYTSGTSELKGAMLTHKNVLNRLKAVASAFGVTNSERILSYLPLGHIAELITTFFGQIYCGYTVYFTEYTKEAILNSEKYGKNFPFILQQVRPTIFIAVPRIWTSFRKKIETQLKNSPVPEWLLPQWLKKHIIKKKLGFGQTRVFISTAAQFNSDDLAFFADLGIPILDVYGQTETAGPLTLNGWPLNVRMDIADKNQEIIVCGDCVMHGYYKNPSATAGVFYNDCYDGSTIYHTGDMGVWNGSRIFWTGRVGDGFKDDKGEYYQPDKIGQLEEKIKKIDTRISEVIACGVNKPHLIALIFSENYKDTNLQERIRQELPKIGEGRYKARGFALISSAQLELTPTMKVKRNAMLKKYSSVIGSLYK